MRLLLTAFAVLALTTLARGAGSIPPPQTSPSAGEDAIATYFTEDSVGDVQLGN